MQKRLANFLLLLFVLQTTELGELLRLPLLVEHYAQHKRLNPRTTVFGFIKMHYVDKTVLDADYAQDMQLPFKTPCNQSLSLQLSLPPGLLILGIPDAFELRTKIGTTQSKVSTGLSNSIFQPPKTALRKLKTHCCVTIA
jgi:hypothetical protein